MEDGVGMDTKPPHVSDYLAALPDEARTRIEELRQLVLSTAPDAVESMSYGMPAFKYRGRPLVYVGAWKNHCALYGTAEGTIRFPPDAPLPEARLRALIRARVAEIEAGMRQRQGKQRGAGASTETWDPAGSPPAS